MDWKLAVEAEQAMLTRIAALLCALADLAELACDRSPAVRGFVLWLLLPAETLVRGLVTGTPDPVALLQAGNSPADAMRLAQSLRSLAALLALSCQVLACANDAVGLSGAPGLISGIPAHVGALGTTHVEAMARRACTPMPYDTS